MIKHIVTWKLKDSAHGNDKATNAKLIKAMLESLNGKVEGMMILEVGIDDSATDESHDIALYSVFDGQQSLDTYQAHPEHLAMKPFIKEARIYRVMVDYEV